MVARESASDSRRKIKLDKSIEEGGYRMDKRAHLKKSIIISAIKVVDWCRLRRTLRLHSHINCGASKLQQPCSAGQSGLLLALGPPSCTTHIKINSLSAVANFLATVVQIVSPS